MTIFFFLALCGVDPSRGLEERLMAHVRVLAADSMEGRGLGTAGIGLAEAYLRRQMDNLGMPTPRWSGSDTVVSSPGPVVNVVGAAGPESTVIVLCAHYDHLGLSPPDSTGVRHPFNGAHDNASGVAVVLEAARLLGSSDLPSGLVALFSSGEEVGLLGARGFLAATETGRIRAAICIDAVGHLDSTLLIIGGHGQRALESLTTESLEHAGIRAQHVPSLPSGDHVAFLELLIPALGFSTGPHPLMNTTEDDAHTLNYRGMAILTRGIVECVHALASLPEPLETPPPVSVPKEPSPPRRVRFGTMPDFSFEGDGMRVAGVTPSSPAEAAGIAAGDVLLRLGNQEIAGAGDLARILADYAPGDTVEVGFRRGGEKRAARVVLRER